MKPPLFAARDVRAVELETGDLPALQAFFDANPEYFVAVGGAPPAPDEALREFHDAPPAEYGGTRRWVLGFVDEDGALVAMAGIVSDLLAPHVWHIGLFIVATARHGSGTAASLHAALESWMRAAGAQWLRLGVVAGNARAERFWARQGYVEVRRRDGIAMGVRVNTVRVLVKPLTAQPLADYLERVARDRPDSP